jgi:hypothetical protein
MGGRKWSRKGRPRGFRTRPEGENHPTNQSTNQPIWGSTNQPISQPIKQSTTEIRNQPQKSTNQPTKQPTNPIIRSANHSLETIRPIKRLNTEIRNHPQKLINQSTNQLIDNQSTNQPNQSTNQPQFRNYPGQTDHILDTIRNLPSSYLSCLRGLLDLLNISKSPL